MSHKKIIIENLASLLVLQGVNYLLPLITLPYLVRILGAEKYGLLSFAFAFVQYFVVFVDYGFNLSATRQISIYRDDSRKVSEIFSSVMVIKTILTAISCLLFCLLIAVIPKFRNDWLIYLASFIAVIGNLLYPVWFYQGMEKMKYIAVVNSVAKILITLTIFIFVKKQSDLIVAVLIQSAGTVFAGILGILFVKEICSLIYIKPTLKSLKITLDEGWPIFVSLMSVNLFTNTNIFILGIFTNNQTVGYFSIGYKIVSVIHNLVNPISSAIFPRVSTLFQESKEEALRFLRKIMILGSIVFVLLSLLLFFGADIAVRVITGQYISKISILIRIMSLLPILTFIDNIYGTQIMLNNNMSKIFMRALVIGGIFSIVSALLLVPIMDSYGAAIVLLLSEIVVLSLMYFPVKRKNIMLFSLKYE
jgi:PST family polysaccharide transporter